MSENDWARRAGRTPVDEGVLERLEPIVRLIHKYCRVTVTGTEHIPEGKALFASNHTGWSGLDGMNVVYAVHDALGRHTHTAAHAAWFRHAALAGLMRRMGFFEAGVTEATELLDNGSLVLFFPEGEAGNFKPFWHTYELQRFKPGFARVALAAAAPIVPVIVVGGEEATPVLTRLQFTKELVGVGLPVPLSLVPLPVKWRITFLPPIEVDSYLAKEGAVDVDLAEALRRDVEARMQAALRDEVEKRGHPFW